MPQRTDFWPESADFGLERAILGPERGLRGELILGLRGLIFCLSGLILGLRGPIWGLRGAWGGTDVQTYVMVHPCVLQDIGPLGPLPKKQGHISISKVPGVLIRKNTE